MTIVGFDPGTATTGFAVIEQVGREWKVKDIGVIATPAGMPAEYRLKEIADDAGKLLDTYAPAVVAVEQLFFDNNQKTGIAVAQARGVLLLEIARRGIRLHEMTPLQVKQAITGYGKADKHQVQEMVKKVFNLAEAPRPDDAADALALAYATIGR